MLRAAVAAVEKMGQPQDVVIVDSGGVDLGALRMTGAKYLGLKRATAKAQTAA